MTNFKKGQWVRVNWKKVYPILKGQVLKQEGSVTTVVVPDLGTIDFPTEKLKETNKPKRN